MKKCFKQIQEKSRKKFQKMQEYVEQKLQENYEKCFKQILENIKLSLGKIESNYGIFQVNLRRRLRKVSNNFWEFWASSVKGLGKY